MSNRGSDLLTGILIGGVIGIIVGILYAPKSGKETREDLSKGAEELLARARDEYDQAVLKSRKAYETVLQRLKDLELASKVENVDHKIKEMTERGAEVVQEGTGRLKRAVEAGVQAFKEETSSQGKG